MSENFILFCHLNQNKLSWKLEAIILFELDRCSAGPMTQPMVRIKIWYSRIPIYVLDSSIWQIQIQLLSVEKWGIFHIVINNFVQGTWTDRHKDRQKRGSFYTYKTTQTMTLADKWYICSIYSYSSDRFLGKRTYVPILGYLAAQERNMCDSVLGYIKLHPYC